MSQILYEMRVKCAWCGKLLYISQSVLPGRTSHGICVECKKQLFENFSEKYTLNKPREVSA